MKKLLLLASVLTFALSATAQERELVTDSYSRNSISIVVVDRDDRHDDMVYNAVRDINYGDKFDRNYIRTTRIESDSLRRSEWGVSNINRAITARNIGHEVIKYWFDSNHDNVMDITLVEKRGRYNADDQDVEQTEGEHLGEQALFDSGYDLVNSSYVIVLDYFNFEKGKNYNDEPTESVSLRACVYKVEFPEDIADRFYAECWIDETTPEAEIEARRKAFAAMNISVKHVASVKSSSTRTVEAGGAEAAIKGAYSGAISQLETTIEAWKVIVGVSQVKPIRAKIGTKEGLKNTNRYVAYQVVAKTIGDQEITFSKKQGFVRATKVANNSSNATGDSPMSEFYQISRVKNIQAGQLLKQSNDLGMGVSVAPKFGGLSSFNVTVDYLMDMKTNGTSTYAIMDFGMGMITASEIDDANINSSYMSDGLSFMNVGLGAGYGYRLSRFVELMPSVMIGGDYMQSNSEIIDGESSEKSEEEMMKYVAYYGNVGVKLNITIAYPLQLFAGADFSMIVSEGEYYKQYNDILDAGGIRRIGGLGITFGAKYIF